MALSLYKKLEDSIFIPQGGFCKISEDGIRILADELIADIKANQIKNPKIFYSSGTGTSSLFLSKALKKHSIDVITSPTIGDGAYLKSEFEMLEEDSSLHPIVIESATKLQFGKPKVEILDIYHSWLERGIEFDLIYDSPFWFTILQNMGELDSQFGYDWDMVFVHSGGTSGNITQLKRYEIINMPKIH